MPVTVEQLRRLKTQNPDRFEQNRRAMFAFSQFLYRTGQQLRREDNEAVGRQLEKYSEALEQAALDPTVPEHREKIDTALDTLSTMGEYLGKVSSSNYGAGNNCELVINSDADREGVAKVEGEARFLRAYYYLTLVSLYGQPYQPQTASRQPGVPLKTSPEVEDRKWQRSTVAEVFQLVEGDLLQAEAAFDRGAQSRRSIYRADQTAVRLLLSRVYLYMQQWQQAAAYARKVTGVHGQLCDLPTSTEPMMTRRPRSR